MRSIQRRSTPSSTSDKTGDPQDRKSVVGPLITPAAVKHCDDRVKEAIAKGAKLPAGATFEGQIYLIWINSHSGLRQYTI
jgi:acyl-CoA reductase-like NAD-dependent aldehyde dehydrogenase